jgi:hypothetical protein
MMTVKYIGAYRVAVPESERAAALKCHDDDVRYVSSELDSLALVELEIRGAPKGLDLCGFKQPHTECVPYNEACFDVETLQRIPAEQYRVPQIPDFRIAFHLHFFDVSEPLETPFGRLKVGPLSDPPQHLSEVRYVYWD